MTFELPKGWEWCILDELSYNITDGTHQTPIYTNFGKPFISAQHIKPFKFSPDDRKKVSDTAYLEFVSKKGGIGDILITRVGAIGEAAVIDQEIEFAFYVSVGLIQMFTDFVNPYYIEIVINSTFW